MTRPTERGGDGRAVDDDVYPALTIALLALTIALLSFSVTRLRRETTVSLRALVLGAVVPMLTTVTYLALGGPPFHVVVVTVAGAIGVATGAIAVVVSRTPSGVAPFVRQSGLALAVWTIVYAVTVLLALIPNADAQAVAAIALCLSAGAAAGTQIGLALRARSAAAREMEPAHFTHAGRRYLLGYTKSLTGIWDRADLRWPVAHYARSASGRSEAGSQFAQLEPGAQAVSYYPHMSLTTIADEPVLFTHVGPRFAFGRSSAYYGIWDRWTPGRPVAIFGADETGASRAWQTFSSWEPSAVAI